MSSWARKACLVLTPALALSVALLGCSGDKDGKKPGDKKSSDGKKEGGDDTKGPEMKAIKPGKGVITGTVTVSGDASDSIAEAEKNIQAKVKGGKNEDHCKAHVHQ